MEIKVLEYRTVNELNEFFKSRQKIESAKVLPFILKTENEREIIFEYKNFWKTKKEEVVIFIFLVIFVVIFFSLLSPLLNFIKSNFDDINIKVIETIITIPGMILIFKLYKLILFRKNLTFRKNKIISKVFDYNKEFMFSSVEMGNANGILYAAFTYKKSPVKNGVILVDTDEKTDLIKMVKYYTNKFNIELNEKNIEY